MNEAAACIAMHATTDTGEGAALRRDREPPGMLSQGSPPRELDGSPQQVLGRECATWSTGCSSASCMRVRGVKGEVPRTRAKHLRLRDGGGGFQSGGVTAPRSGGCLRRCLHLPGIPSAPHGGRTAARTCRAFSGDTGCGGAPATRTYQPETPSCSAYGAPTPSQDPIDDPSHRRHPPQRTPHRDRTSPRAIRVERGPERSGCFT